MTNDAPVVPDYPELVRVFARIGWLSFGGPAGQIAMMHKEIVEERRWIDENQYLHALNFCHLLPGPEAQQLATWIGWKLHGTRGGLTAGLLFILPGAAIILLLSILYAWAANLDWFAALFLGIKAAILAIVVQALLRVSARALTTPFKRLVAIGAFMALFLFALPFPLVVLGAGVIGILVGRTRPDWLGIRADDNGAPVSQRPSWRMTLRTLAGWSLIWLSPMALIALTLGQDHVLWHIGSFFSQLAVVTFGGAYAVLAYVAQEAVQGFGWLRPGEMADGLGLAETTPGPLILVTQFVGYLAAFRSPEPFSPLVAGIAGALLTSWVTFAPCFLWIFLFAPWIERLEHAKALKAGLSALTAAIVGVIANLSLWFALHVLFAKVDTLQIGPLHVSVPVWNSVDWKALGLAALAAGLQFGLKRNVVTTLAVTALAGLILGVL